jgi:hypothetical protein
MLPVTLTGFAILIGSVGAIIPGLFVVQTLHRPVVAADGIAVAGVVQIRADLSTATAAVLRRRCHRTAVVSLVIRAGIGNRNTEADAGNPAHQQTAGDESADRRYPQMPTLHRHPCPATGSYAQ